MAGTCSVSESVTAHWVVARAVGDAVGGEHQVRRVAVQAVQRDVEVACSLLVGMPVEGPTRMTSTMTTGVSALTARPSDSVISAGPGPRWRSARARRRRMRR
jgi:hypothetical protein